MVGACSTHREHEKFIENFDWKIEGKMPHGRSSHRWEDSIRMHVR